MHVNIAHHRPVEPQHFVDLSVHLSMVGDCHRLDAIGLDQFQKVRRSVPFRAASFSAPLKVGLLIGFGDSVYMVVQDERLDLHAIVQERLQLLQVHVETAVSDRADHLAGRIRKPGSHGAGK